MNTMNAINPIKPEPPVASPSRQSFSERLAAFGKSYVTWEGRAISQIDPAEFLSSKAPWPHNLKLLTNASKELTIHSLITKEIYCWQPKDSYITGGFTSYKEQKNAMASHSFFRWMQTGIIAGVSYAFAKAMYINFECLESADEHLCRLQYNEALSHRGLIAKAAVAAGYWFLASMVVNNIGDYGLRGLIKEKQLANEMFAIYKSTLESTSIAFWDAVDRQDKATAQTLYNCVRTIKMTSKDNMNRINLYLGISEETYVLNMRTVNMIIEDIVTQDMESLFPLPATGTTPAEAGVKTPDSPVEKVVNTDIKAGGEHGPLI